MFSVNGFWFFIRGQKFSLKIGCAISDVWMGAPCWFTVI